MRRDRFLIFVLVGLAVLAMAAILSVVIRTQHEGYVDDNTPAGVVHNFVLALQWDDFEQAYLYLADGEYKPSLSEIRSYVYSNGLYQNTSIRIGETHVDGNEATVELAVLNLRSGAFLIDELNERDDIAVLIRQDSVWRLTQMPYEFWVYGWYRQARDPMPVYPP
jgi:hypothetical protein